MTFHGTNETKRKSHQTKKNSISSFHKSKHFSFIEPSLQIFCNLTTKIHISIDPLFKEKYSNTVIGLFLENPSTKRRLFIDSHQIQEEIEIKLPCIFQDKKYSSIYV